MNSTTVEKVRETVAALQAAPGISVRYEHLTQHGLLATKFGGVFPGILWFQSGETGLALYLGEGNPPHEMDASFGEWETELGHAIEKLQDGKGKLFLSTVTVDAAEVSPLYQSVATALPESAVLPEKVAAYVPQVRDAGYYPAGPVTTACVIRREVLARLGVKLETPADQPLPLPDPETLRLLVRDATKKYWWDANGNDSQCYRQGRKEVLGEYVRHGQLVYLEEGNKAFQYAERAGYIPENGVYFSEYCATTDGRYWDRCIFATPKAANAIRAGIARQRREYAQHQAEIKANQEHPDRRRKVLAQVFCNDWSGTGGWLSNNQHANSGPIKGPALLTELQRRQALLCGSEPLKAFEFCGEFKNGRQTRWETPVEELARQLLVGWGTGIVGAMGYLEKGTRDPDPDPARMIKEGGMEEAHRAFRWLIEEVQRRWQALEQRLVSVTSELRRVARQGIVPVAGCSGIPGELFSEYWGKPAVAFQKAIVVGSLLYLPDIISPEMLERLKALAPSYDESKGHPLGAFGEIQAGEELPANIAELLGVPRKRVPYVPAPDPEPKEWVIKNS